MLVNRSRQKREPGQCQYCSDPRSQLLDGDGRCPVCQFTSKRFLSEVDGDTTVDEKRGGRPIEMSPSVSVPHLLDPELGLARAQRLALIVDSCCTPIVLRDDGARRSLPLYSLRLRPLLAQWVGLNILNSGDEMAAYRQYANTPPAPPGRSDWAGLDPGSWSTYLFTTTMDVYILSRVMSAHCMELRAYARQVVFHLHTKYGPRQEWDQALGIHPSDPTASRVFEWPTWSTLPPGLYGLPPTTPLPGIRRLYITDEDRESMRQDPGVRADIEGRQ